MVDLTLSPITRTDHAEDALDLAMRAADYVTLEVGHAPNMDFIDSFFTAAPPGLTERDLLHFAIMEGPAMVGMLCIAKGYELPEDWWIGLVLLDPAFRGRGIGRTVVHLIKEAAQAEGIAALKLSVLEANPRAMHFWIREGFLPHRYATATADSDGHNRWVLVYDF
ncbi:GNAT family N-acetyltransferase [uncultured Roseobacter sp.]|uniref:GNAT family N-acetyltransferase n=1 Tax=uncultured Roseobacter sp. TaxID=114847 RepID=UPI002615100E|nr:GNAT family N-acetyltransferase [uncultured Roseobacter sp.]